MDLLATVRKEGSRGGAGDFKWSDVQNSSHREHYLGHSLMAPVGRWARGRDLNWYAKGDGDAAAGEDPAEKAARDRKEEIKRIKQAEEDALARALGLPVPDRSNANMEPVSDKRDVDRVLKEATDTNDDIGKGIGFGSSASAAHNVMGEIIEGVGGMFVTPEATTMPETDTIAVITVIWSASIINLIETIIDRGIVTDQVRDIEIDLVTDNDATEIGQGQEAVIKGLQDGIEIAYAHSLLVGGRRLGPQWRDAYTTPGFVRRPW